MQTNQLTFERSIHAPVSQLFRAFTRSAALREWLCDTATTEPRPGGRIYLWWERGYYASGEFLKVETDQEISFKWQGRNEPGPTEVRITLSQNGDVTNLQLVHSGLGSGEVWDKAAEEFRKGWENGLENLVHTLEQGPDLRITTRPMMGIGLDDFNESIAKEIGVPVTKGVRISNAIEGMGAQAAGLRNNDVVVGLSGFEVTDFASLSAAMHGRKAGELVQMTFYRGPEKMTVTMTLSHRPIPVIPPTPAELADAVRAILTQCETQLDEFFTGITDEEAGRKISENEWSAKGILAHLIHSERGWQNALDEIVTDSEPSYDHFGGNNNARIEATLSVYPSLTDLLAELKRLYAETIACIANMPPEFVARKPAYWRVGFQALQLKSHFDIHLEQMQSIIKPV
jgi:uncharacterized protein YndB with AHSA1/START domain